MKFYKIFFLLVFSLVSLISAQDEDDDFEFEDDDFEFEDDDFDFEDLDEFDDFDLEDDDFDELLEEFELEEEEGFEEGVPREYGFGLTIGTMLPFGQNIRPRFNNGINIGLNIETPLGFYFGPFEVILGGEISYASLSAKTSGCSSDIVVDPCYFNPNSDPYSMLNFSINAKTKILLFDVIGGLSLTQASATSLSAEIAPHGELVNSSGLAIIVDASYKLPFSIGPMTMGLKFRAQEILAMPGETGVTSDLIGFGLILNYKL